MFDSSGVQKHSWRNLVAATYPPVVDFRTKLNENALLCLASLKQWARRIALEKCDN